MQINTSIAVTAMKIFFKHFTNFRFIFYRRSKTLSQLCLSMGERASVLIITIRI